MQQHSVGNNATVARDKAWTMPLHVYLCGTVHHVVAGQMNIQLIVDGIPVDTTVVGRMPGTLAWMEEMKDGSMEEVVVVDVPTTGEGLEVSGGGIRLAHHCLQPRQVARLHVHREQCRECTQGIPPVRG